MTNLEILMADNCTRSEAEKHLERGTVVFDDLEEHFSDYMAEWDMDEEEQEKIREMIRSKKPLPDWGVVQAEGKAFYIMYCL